MAVERTLSKIKPDGVRRNLIGEVIGRFERNGLKVLALKMEKLTKARAEKFYDVHKGKPFYKELVTFMSSGPVVPMVLEGEDAIRRVREIMGATNPKDALPGTIRGDLAKEVTENIVHGSDGPDTARGEIEFYFGKEILK